MLKFVLSVAVVQQLLLQIHCFDSWERCEVDEEYGICVPLCKCKAIADEIKNAGNPMPKYMRIKLQKLACGFDITEPIICCVSLSLNDTTDDLETLDQGVIDGNETPTHKPTDIVFPGIKPIITDNVEAFTRRSLEDRSGPRAVAGHPNINLLPRECGEITDDRIIWGGYKAKLYEMPFMVLLSYDSDSGLKLSCSGTIINKWYILTAAHCVINLESTQLKLRLVGVIIGEYDVRYDPDCEMIDGEEDCAPKAMNHTIDLVIPHPGYSSQTFMNDIALIRLSQPADITLDTVKPICLPIARHHQTEILTNLTGMVAGWGVTENGFQSPVLLRVELPIVSPEDCGVAYNGTAQINVTQICAGGVKNKDSCKADSGGPLIYPGRFRVGKPRYIQRGIVSFGTKKCGISGYPSVYTNVAYYMDWILDNIHD